MPSPLPDLPITASRDEIMAAIAAHQVVVVAGETGSGKSTQLPQFCLAMGRGAEALIGHTQPRRIAARSVAERVAEELGTDIGGVVGYTVRFNDQVGAETRIKVMTDGILLAEIQRDRDLSRYDTIIIDEAHERSLNIDFLLGYLHRLLPRRPDLRVIITSATIDTERFAAHFSDAPVIEVSGRSYPVELRYQPLDDPDDPDDSIDQTEGICRAVSSLIREGPGDILVFCSGEREIRDAAQSLRGLKLRDTEILPLYARLSSAEQHRVFEAHSGRRIVLATNVAETSLTVPGVRYVVDPGTARISRYSHRTKVQRLPIEPISRASADQRAGRCGRVGPGICIRLFSEDDLESRTLFTEPEIQRTSLASVILQMAALGLGDVEEFPFVDPPDTRAIRDGITLLAELGAVDPDAEGTDRWLTPLGRQMATLPLDPRLGRMLLAASEHGCLHEVMVIAAALSIQDPRERPTGPTASEAAAMHRRFDVEGSDLLAHLRLWDHLHAIRSQQSYNQFRRQCRAEFLHVLRIREWQDLYTQLAQVAKRLRLDRNRGPADPDQVHRSILTGLLSHIGMQTGVEREYRGARNSRFTLARQALPVGGAGRWVMAAELVETNRLWARGVARIKPEWIEEAGAHLVQRTFSAPWWDRARGVALATERVTIFGLPLVADRSVAVDRIDPVRARQLFIRHALVDGDWDRTDEFIHRNAARVVEVEELGIRARRDVLADPDRIAAFFDERIPEHVASARSFGRWWTRRRARDPLLLDLPAETLIDADSGPIDADAFPDVWMHNGVPLPLHYEFDPDRLTDGVTVEVPVSLLATIDPAPFEWNVPGWRGELIDALIRTLPKPIRRAFVPVPDTVALLVERLDPSTGGLLDSLRTELGTIGGQALPRDAFDLDRVPGHLRMTFMVIDEHRTVLAVGHDLAAIRRELGATVREALGALDVDVVRSGLTDWPGGTIPRVRQVTVGGHTVDAYPALVDEGETVAVRLFADRDEQAEAMWAGTRRLLQLRLPAASRALGRLPNRAVRRSLSTSPYADEAEWQDDMLTAVFDHLIDSGGGTTWTADGFDVLLDHVRAGLGDTLRHAWAGATEILHRHAALTRTITGLEGPGFASARADIAHQLDRLVYRGSLAAMGLDRLSDVTRYLEAIERRLLKLRDDPDRDRERMARCRRLEADYDDLRARVPWSLALEEVGWLLEEFRVATFAQQLGTTQSVSEKRLWSAMAALDDR